MTTATWWLTKKIGITAIPEIADEPPILVDPGQQTYYPGEQVSLQIDNIGGPVSQWGATGLPNGLSITEQTPDYCVISGTAQALTAPVLQNPGDQGWYEGKLVDFYVNNTGGGASTWSTTAMPEGVRVTEENPDYIRIQNADVIPLEPLDTTFFEQYLDAQHGPVEGFIGYGPQVVENWECYEAGNSPDDCGISLDAGPHFYDYGRSAMSAYHYFRQVKGVDDTRWVSYADGDANVWNKYYFATGSPTGIAGYRFFTGGMTMLRNYDPVTYDWVNTSLQRLAEEATYNDANPNDIEREETVREVSYAVLMYLDYLYDKPANDPIWSNMYPSRRTSMFNFFYQWLDECKEWGYADPIEYNEVGVGRLGNARPNLFNFAPFMSTMGIEAMLRILYNDPEVDTSQAISDIRRTSKIIFDNLWINSRTQCLYRWYNCAGCVDGTPIDACDTYGGNWCSLMEDPAEWSGPWQLQHLGMCYVLTGDRRWIDRGDEIWNKFWGSDRLFRYLNNDPGASKINTQILRYTFEYLTLRGDMEFQTYLTETTGIGQSPPVPTKKQYPAITNAPASQTLVLNTPYSLQLEATNTPTSWKGILLPNGLSIDNAGLISGTPTTVDPSVLSTFIAINSDGYGDEEVIDFEVQDVPSAPVISPIADQYNEVDQAITPFTPTASGSPTSWAVVDPLPTGISLNTTTGEISGTPTVRSFQVSSITATNAIGTSAPQTIDWTIHGAAADAPDVQSPGNQTVTVGVPYSIRIRNLGGPTVTWTVRVGWLPSGLSVTDDTQPYYLDIGGTPT